MNNYQVTEYTELDFEHVVLETPPVPQCEGCDTPLESLRHAGIHKCPVCDYVQFTDMEV